MALLHDELSVWEIAFRWAGRDPDRVWLRFPLQVRDNFRMLMDAILNGHLDCSTLSLRKWNPDTDDKELQQFFIRYHLDAVENCVWGRRFDRKLLRWARIERWAMQQWCERRGVPIPEFWFPPGWKLEYEWPDDDPTEAPPSNSSGPAGKESTEERKQRVDKNHRIRMACQQIALAIWAKEPNLTIKEVAHRREVQELGGGSEREPETLYQWISAVDTRDPSKKRGVKRKSNSPPDDSQ